MSALVQGSKKALPVVWHKYFAGRVTFKVYLPWMGKGPGKSSPKKISTDDKQEVALCRASKMWEQKLFNIF